MVLKGSKLLLEDSVATSRVQMTAGQVKKLLDTSVLAEDLLRGAEPLVNVGSYPAKGPADRSGPGVPAHRHPEHRARLWSCPGFFREG